jgi:hypothetical protein
MGRSKKWCVGIPYDFVADLRVSELYRGMRIRWHTSGKEGVIVGVRSEGFVVDWEEDEMIATLESDDYALAEEKRLRRFVVVR